MAKPDLKEKARELRRKGLSYRDITKKLNVSKSSVSLWCRDIELSDIQIETLKNNKIKASMNLIKSNFDRSEYNNSLRDRSRKLGKDIVADISDRDLMMIGLGLYWGEGNKRRNDLGFSNSDPKMLRFIIKWFKLFDIEKDMLKVKICIPESIQVEDAETYWVNQLEIERDQLYKTIISRSPSSKLKIKREGYMGVVQLIPISKRMNEKKFLVHEKILGMIDYFDDVDKW